VPPHDPAALAAAVEAQLGAPLRMREAALERFGVPAFRARLASLLFQ
jgi:hypothetical protein